MKQARERWLFSTPQFPDFQAWIQKNAIGRNSKTHVSWTKPSLATVIPTTYRQSVHVVLFRLGLTG
jgi:hypothetical protein